MTEIRMDGEGRQEWRRHWPVVLSGAAGMALASVPAYTQGVMLLPLQHEFGWTRAAISSGPLISAAAAVPLGTILGWAIDRFGPRRIGIIGVIISCVSLALLAAATSAIWTWWVLWGVFALTSTLVKPAVWAAGVSSLFSRTRGLGLAAMLCGTAIASTITPAMTNYLVEKHGWRVAYLAVALVWGVLVFPLVLFLFNSASDYHRGRKSENASVEPAALSGMASGPALASWRYLRLSIGSIAMVLATVTCVVNLVPILISLGRTPAAAAGIVSLIGVTTIFGRLAGGFLLDRLNGNVVAAFSIALPMVAILLLIFFPSSLTAVLAAVMILGLSMGAELDAVAYLTSRHFGLRSFGVLYGTIGGLQALATGLGPFLVSGIYDAYGSYRIALWLFIPICLLGAVMFLSLGPYPDFAPPTEGEVGDAVPAAAV